MKRLLLTLLAALALPTAVEANWFGKYGSYYEAMEACEQWRDKIIYYVTEMENKSSSDWQIIGVKYSKVSNWDKKTYVEKLDPKITSTCSHEKETNKVLGFSVKGFSQEIVHKKKDLIYSKKKVLKRFKY